MSNFQMSQSLFGQSLAEFFRLPLLTRTGLLAVLLVGLVSLSPPSFADDAASLNGGAITVNINEADAATLASGLTGVGLSRAEKIVRYRETYGPFASVDELAEVKGIGPSTVDKNRTVIRLD